MAIDRDRIMKVLFNKRFIKAVGPVPLKIGNYKSPDKGIPYNPEKSRKIISKFNIGNKELNIFIKADHQVALIAQMIQYYLNKAGLNVGIQEMEWSALKAATINGKYDMAYFTWHADYPEAENFLFPLFYSKNSGTGGNRSFFKNREVDKLLIKAAKTIENNKRFSIYRDIERIIIDEAPWIFLWYGDKKIALSERIKKFIPYPTYNGMKGNEIEL